VDATVESRVACCSILGAIAPRLTKEAIERRFLAKAMAWPCSFTR